MKIEVTSVSRKKQALSSSAAAVYVITREDIWRSGATTIPEILRLAPGLMVARIDANKWAVGARGEAGRFANKMLVLIDGRSVYNNLYSGVYWDQNDTLLADIERVEVIRGPGGTMWGANAVNAVINIITRSAEKTQGLLATVGGGTEDHVVSGVRYGGSLGESTHYRGYVKYMKRGSLISEGVSAGDEWDTLRSGGRVEWQPSQRDHVAVHGDLYRGRADETVVSNDPANPQRLHASLETSGGYGLVRWERVLAPGSETALQVYYNRENRHEYMGVMAATTVDAEFQHRRTLGSRNDLLWGGNFRVYSDRVKSGQAGQRLLAVEARTDPLYSAFIQNDFVLVPDRLVLTAGAKVLHNSYTGMEWQPGVRLLWTPTPRHSFWGAVARAVRTPSRFDHDLSGVRFNLPAPEVPGSVAVLNGNPDFHSEAVHSHEAGWRWQAGKRFNLDVAGFLTVNRGLQSLAARPEPPGGPAPDGPPVLPTTLFNGLEEKRGGFETVMNLHLTPNWRVQANYSRCSSWDVKDDPRTAIALNSAYRKHQAQLRSSWDIRRRYSVELNVYAVSGLQQLRIPGHTRVDFRVGTRLGESFEWSIGVRDTFTPSHLEFLSFDYVRSSEARRSVYTRLTWGH